MGTGVGGEYPLAATVTSESSSAGKRGSLMSAVFAMQGVGSLVSGLVVISCLLLGYSTSFTWRFALAFGAVPPLLAFPYRLRMHETETFERVKKERAAAQLHNEMMLESEKNPIAYPDDMIGEKTALLQTNPSDGHGTFAPSSGHFVRLPDGRAFYQETLSDGSLSKDEESPNSRDPAPSLSGAAVMPSNVPARVIPHDSSYGQFEEMHSRSNSANSLGHLYSYHTKPSAPAVPDSPRWAEIKRAFTFYRWHLLGTALTWFLLDVDFYANGLFNHEVTAIILKPPDVAANEHTTAMQDACNSIIISCISIPGYLLSVFFLDRVGRKNVQMMGFSMMAILFFICGFAFDWLLGEHSTMMGRYLFMIIYALTFLFRYPFCPYACCC